MMDLLMCTSEVAINKQYNFIPFLYFVRMYM